MRTPSDPDQGRRRALDGNIMSIAHDQPAITDEQAFAMFCGLMAYVIARAAVPAVFTQRNLPPDAASAASYMDRHRALRAAGVAGVWTRGKTLACTPQAWATQLPKRKRHVSTPPPGNDVRASMERAWGVTTRGKTS